MVRHLNDKIMPDEEDYILNMAADDLEAHQMDSQDEVFFPDHPSQFDPSDVAQENKTSKIEVEGILEDVICAVMSITAVESRSGSNMKRVNKAKMSVVKKYLNSASAQRKLLYY